MASTDLKGRWALILGASSGFGEATALKLSSLGMNIAGVHLDMKTTLPHVESVIEKIQSQGSRTLFFNTNAADVDKIREISEKLKAEAPEGIHCLMHSLAFGTLKPFIADDPKQRISDKEMDMTCEVMAHSLVYWAQALTERKLLAQGCRIFAMTSAGGARVWPKYGAVSAAKAALESHCRQLALELAPLGVTVNSLRAGVTVTPALRKIPGHEEMIELATKRNPMGRLTQPEDLANLIGLLLGPGANWLTGDVLGVDGGEDIVG